ncbi:hypothetical protein Avbf_18274, partial [Armadillidium vulgare]
MVKGFQALTFVIRSQVTIKYGFIYENLDFKQFKLVFPNLPHIYATIRITNSSLENTIPNTQGSFLTVELAPFGNIEIDGDKYPKDLSYSVSTVYCETPEEKCNPSPDIHLGKLEHCFSIFLVM